MVNINGLINLIFLSNRSFIELSRMNWNRSKERNERAKQEIEYRSFDDHWNECIRVTTSINSWLYSNSRNEKLLHYRWWTKNGISIEEWTSYSVLSSQDLASSRELRASGISIEHNDSVFIQKEYIDNADNLVVSLPLPPFFPSLILFPSFRMWCYSQFNVMVNLILNSTIDVIVLVVKLIRREWRSLTCVIIYRY